MKYILDYDEIKDLPKELQDILFALDEAVLNLKKQRILIDAKEIIKES